jgi:succinyl-CoA synthetase beta subunit
MPPRQLTEPESLELLSTFGVPTVPTVFCESATAARAAADRLGYPVVLKGVADGVAHKSDLGLVHVGLRDEDAVTRAFAATGCDTVVVQAMIRGELEAIAGVTRADGVGLMLLAGLGGIHAEAFRNVTMWPIPVSRETIEQGLRGSALGRVLHGPRWKHPNTASAFVDVLLGLQAAAVALGERLHAIDVNPVILGEHGAVAVDALVIPVS